MYGWRLSDAMKKAKERKNNQRQDVKTTNKDKKKNFNNIERKDSEFT